LHAAQRYLTAEVPGVGGVLRQRPEDFLVEEIPAYSPSGEGEHLYLFLEKRELSTSHMIRLLADHFGVRRTDVGVAGLKDKHAVTRQLVSVHLPGKKDSEFPAFEHPSIAVHWTDRHANKLRRGHLQGNRFIIRIRNVEPTKVIHAHRALMILARGGVPNRIGPQRFGHLQHNHLVGRALMKFDHAEALRYLLGPSEQFPGVQVEARRAFSEGKYQDAFEMLPRAAHTERRVLSALAKGKSARDAVRAIEPLDYSFFVTAVQSAVFNRVLDARLLEGTLTRLLPGDLAFKHDNGAVFAVNDDVLAEPATAQRLERLEISPSGPMWGAGMTRAAGRVAEMEEQALVDLGLSIPEVEHHAERTGRIVDGVRRPLRVPLTYPDIEAGVDEHGAYIKCIFELPRGAFATTVMAEIMKVGAGGTGNAGGDDGLSADDDEAES
jgi:tRNA pseudouridine13 synthase